MMSCDSFRTRFHVGADDAALLEHVRTCDRCLDFAAHVDPDVMFRALGGSEMIPPGGLDAFVGGVMQQVRVRDMETVAATRTASWPRRLAMAAAIGVAVFGATLVSRVDAPVQTKSIARSAPMTRPLTTKPIVETYDSQNATIVEVPTDATDDDVKIVMIFDENLPADL
jgi:hypothetical protein